MAGWFPFFIGRQNEGSCWKQLRSWPGTSRPHRLRDFLKTQAINKELSRNTMMSLDTVNRRAVLQEPIVMSGLVPPRLELLSRVIPTRLHATGFDKCREPRMIYLWSSGIYDPNPSIRRIHRLGEGDTSPVRGPGRKCVEALPVSAVSGAGSASGCEARKSTSIASDYPDIGILPGATITAECDF